MSPLANSYVTRRRSSTRREPFYPLHAYVCSRVLPRAARRVRVARADLQRLRVLLVVLARAGSSTPARYVEPIDRARSASDRRQPGRRDRQQRRLPAAVLRRARACPSSASSRRPTSPRSRARTGIPTAVAFFGTELAHAARDEGTRADLLLGNNVLAHVPDLNDFVARHGHAARRRRRHHDGVPAPAAADAAQPVRHHLPRALLVLLVPHRVGASSRTTACASSTSRSSRPTAVRSASTRCHAGDAAHADHRPGAAAARESSGTAGLDRLERLRALPRAGARRRSARCCAS